MPFPYDFNMSLEMRKNDLLVYEPLYAPDGPAMTYSFHVIGWLELNDTERANVKFEKTFEYVHKPFYV
mgnify:CR=1 FL=1